MPAIEIQGLSKRFGEVAAVDGLSFSARAGAVTGFLGPNGAGKSTTLRMLLGLVRPSEGTATIGGKRYADIAEPFRHVGAVLEADAFHPGRSARDHLRVLAVAAGLPVARVDAVLREVDLADAGHRRVKGFSLGMRQRLGLATALLGEPEVLILDEPANGLDPEGVHWLRRFVRAFADGGGTMLISSHVLAEVAQTVDDVVIIADGRLVAQSSLAELANQSRAGVRVRTPQAEALARHPDRSGHLGPARGRRRARRAGEHCRGRRPRRGGRWSRHLRDEAGALQPRGDVPRAHQFRRSIPMKSLIHAELLKLRTTRAFWVYIAAALAFVPVTIAVTMTVSNDGLVLDSSEGITAVFSAASAGGLLLLLLGITMMAGEFRHNTATTTFLVTPDRRRVIAAKLAAGSVVGVLATAVSALLTLAIALPWLAARDIDVDLLSVAVGAPILGGMIANGLWTAFGIGLGAVMPNQTLAITVVVVWTTVVEGLLVGFLPEVGRWLHTGAASALGGTWTAEGGLLPFWGAALVLTGYALAGAAAGTYLVTRKEIT